MFFSGIVRNSNPTITSTLDNYYQGKVIQVHIENGFTPIVNNTKQIFCGVVEGVNGTVAAYQTFIKC